MWEGWCISQENKANLRGAKVHGSPPPQLRRGWLSGSSISPLTCPHLEDGDSDTTRGFSKDKSLLMTGRCFTTSAVLYPRVTQSSQASRKPHGTSARHRNGVIPRADGERRPREVGTAAGSQEQASTVSRSYPFIPRSPRHDLSSDYGKKQPSKEITG